jgi:hypothetical protein
MIMLSSQAAFAQDAEGDAAKMAKLAQNPIAAAISVPFQYNFNFGYPPEDQIGGLFIVQPVIPLILSRSWNLIVRPIIPIVSVPLSNGDSKTALGDINFQTYFTPAKAGKVIWGIGPTFTVPSAGDDMLGSEKFSLGPGLVVLKMGRPWVYGCLLNNQWSVTGYERRADVNIMSFNPFLTYNLPAGWYISTSPIMTANWEADDDNVWTVPVGAGIGKVFRAGKQACNGKISYYYNAERPDSAPVSQLQFQLVLLFPT